jgi:hypothetical protein
MRKLYVLLGTLVICGASGCSEDLNEAYVAGTINVLKRTTSDVEQVTKTISEATTQAKNSNKPLDIAKVARATQEAASLKKQAQELQNLKARMDVRKDGVTASAREEYAANHKGDVQQSLQALDIAQKNLEVALRDADAVADNDGKSALEKLREAIKEARNEFEMVTKRQS